MIFFSGVFFGGFGDSGVFGESGWTILICSIISFSIGVITLTILGLGTPIIGLSGFTIISGDFLGDGFITLPGVSNSTSGVFYLSITLIGSIN